MQSVLGSYDTGAYKKILRTLKDEQKILHLEEFIDNERIKRKQLEQEAQFLLNQIKQAKARRDGVKQKYRSSSMQMCYEDNDYKEKAHVRNTLMSTTYKD
ncbi:hypothetical protein SteCoe_27700 [Stentor coeruleus]|uniref:Uncharacterized protein n=1 Tax=Stentor coeruleus TaxID=5963 RepID=A0A1R2B9V0_9CILI|nr:hypothetical protein SteCoe_27700 [Stentor coeruleus]